MRPSNKRSDGGGGGGGGGYSSKRSKSTDETPAPEPPLPTRAQARAKLTAFFGVFPGILLDLAQEPPEFPLEEALSLLKVHPTLSTESFDDKGRHYRDSFQKRSRIPLSFFIEARADLTTIQQVYHLNPMHRNAHSTSQKFDGVLDACKFGAKEGVIAFLIEKFPRAVEARDRNGNSSLEMVLLHRISISWTENERFEVADLLLKDHRLEDYVTHDKEDSLLRTALLGEYGFRWMCLLFQKCRRLEFFHVPEAADEDDDDDDDEEVLGDFQISTKEAYGLSLLLPKVKTMICHPTSWTFEGLLHFLHSLGSIAKVEDLSLWIPSLFLYGSGNATITSTLQEMLALNTSLREITLMGDSQNDDALLRSIARALSTSNISSVAIVSFSLSQVETLSNFLSACQNTTLHISSLEIQGSWHMAKCWATCKIRALTIDVDGSEWVQGLLSQLDEMPLLERLRLASLHSTNEIDVTTSLVSILAAGKLRCLDVFGLKFNGSIISNALQSDAILEELKLHPVDQSTVTCIVETLECHNTSLKTVSACSPHGGLQEKILYYTRLNRAGRARVSCDEISLEEFVDLLCKAAISTQSPQLGPNANNTRNMLHGLLRISPHIWTPLPKPSPTPRKKYKNSQDLMQGWLELTAKK